MFSQIFRKFLRKVGRFITRNEKVLLAALAVIIVISGGYWYRQFASASEEPTIGGTYIEGMVEDKRELSQIITKLTKTGLFSLDESGQLQPQLIQNWQSNPEKTEYRFDLVDEVDQQEIATSIQGRSDLFPSAIVETADNGDLVIRLSEPNPSLPLLLARPIVDYGPYKLSKSTDQTSVFTRNTRKRSAFSYLNKIIINSYPGDEQLVMALKKNRIDGALRSDGSLILNRFDQHHLELNRYYSVLFNVNRAPFREAPMRQAIANGGNISNQAFTLTVPDQEPYKTLAEKLVADWKERGAAVEIAYKTLEEITGSLGPSRNFQALLIGIDYGADLDPYYIWHSSQVRPPGNNLTGVRDDTVDALVDKTRSTLDIKERKIHIDELHAKIKNLAVAIIVKQETADYYLSNKVHFVVPQTATTAADRFLTTALWSVK